MHQNTQFQMNYFSGYGASPSQDSIPNKRGASNICLHVRPLMVFRHSTPCVVHPILDLVTPPIEYYIYIISLLQLQSKSIGLVWGLAANRRFPFIKWTGWTLAMVLPWWQHHKYHLSYYYYYYYYYYRPMNEWVCSASDFVYILYYNELDGK